MTIDDESSIYIGGLPYDATEDTIRNVFDLYGAIVDIKIINDQRTRGKCYGFVTFTNPGCAINAIGDMNGRTIGGRVVKVNGVKTRGGRSNFGREHFLYNFDRNGDWDRIRNRDRDYNHDREKDGYRNRNNDWSRKRGRSRDREQDKDRRYERIRGDDLAGESLLDEDQSQEGDRVDNGKEYDIAHGQNMERDHHLDMDTESKMNRINDPDRSSDDDRNEQSRRTNGVSIDVSLDPDGNHHDQVEGELKISTQRVDQLKREGHAYAYNGIPEFQFLSDKMRNAGLRYNFLDAIKKAFQLISQMEEKLEERRHLIADLQRQSRKLEDALVNAKTQSSYSQTQLTKLQKCFLQVKDYTERLKTCEKELQALADTVMLEGDENAVGLKDGQLTIENT